MLVLVEDDSVHHDHAIPKRKVRTPSFSLLTLWTVEASTSQSAVRIVAQHEPSVRIFRALLEACLLLACCAASIAVWTRHLGRDTTAQLLFQPAASQWERSSSSASAMMMSMVMFRRRSNNNSGATPVTVVHGARRRRKLHRGGW